jgi:hypothetical protein
MTHGLKHDPLGIEPERRVVALVVLGKLLRREDDLTSADERPGVRGDDGGARRHDECEVLQAGPVPRVLALLERAIEEDVGSGLRICGPVGELLVAHEEQLVSKKGHQGVVVLPRRCEVEDIDPDVAERHATI